VARIDKSEDTLRFDDPLVLFLLFPGLLALYFIVLNAEHLVSRLGAWAAHLPAGILVSASLLIAWEEPFAWLFVALAPVTLIVAACLDRDRAEPRHGLSPALLAMMVAINLAVFVFSRFPGTSHAVLPLGIAVLTCLATAYAVDVYRREATMERPLVALLYLVQFPLMLAGPIVRYRDFSSQHSRLTVSLGGFAYGMRRLMIGLVKVVLVAGALALPADAIFALPLPKLSADAAWLGAACFSLQHYYRFSGCSDIAIGLGRMLGFRYPENFRRPYTADSVREFWRRWNITLMTWLRDYLRLPIAERDDPAPRLYANIVIGFCLVGLWHGGGRGVVIWSLYSGMWLALEAVGLGARVRRLPAVVRHVYLLTVVTIGWVILRADTPSGALAFLQAMAGLNGLAGRTAQHYLTLPVGVALGVAIVGAGPMVPAISRWRVSLDAATVSVLMMVAATAFFLWRGVSFLVGALLPTRPR
jgi:D-alanyl-lipoteichoic acid acyltransferase DltB (MBOAT superfamily)